MLFSKLLWFLAVSGIAAEHRNVGMENRDSMIVRENASLYWTTRILYKNGETYYRISCEKTTEDAARSPRMKDVLFRKAEKQATATLSSKIPPRVKILPPATLFIQRVDLSDEGFYKCEIPVPGPTAFREIRKAINLNLIDLIKMVRDATVPFSTVSNSGQVTVQCEAGGYRYSCEASNWVGQDDTAEFKINVYYSPKIIKPLPEDQIVDENGQVSVRCEAEGYPPPKITWIKLLGNQKVQEGNSMNISDVQRSDHGRYRCVASNGFGQDATAEFKITVYYSPKIIKPLPEDQNVDENGQVSVRCEAEGYPPPKIAWIKLLGNRKVQEGNSMYIRDVQRSDQGRYRCEARNGFGQDATAEFKINVYYKPVINKTASSQNVNAWPGVTTNLLCVADGNPAPRYIWTNSSGIVATSEENGILRVTPQDRDGFGPYKCIVTNNKGKDSLDIQLVRVGYGSEHKFTTCKPSSDPSTRTILFIVLGSLAGLITMAVLIKFWIGRRHKPPASLRLPPDIDENDFKFDVFVTYSS